MLANPALQMGSGLAFSSLVFVAFKLEVVNCFRVQSLPSFIYSTSPSCPSNQRHVGTPAGEYRFHRFQGEKHQFLRFQGVRNGRKL